MVTNDLQSFLKVFQLELIDDSIDESTLFKNHKNWSSLISLIIITEIDTKTGILIEIDTLRNSNTILELYQNCTSEV